MGSERLRAEELEVDFYQLREMTVAELLEVTKDIEGLTGYAEILSEVAAG